MAKETFIINCRYDEVNTKIAVYESFGWELISNNVSATVQTSYDVAVRAANELTFSREKNAPWYRDVSKLQRQYDDLQEKIEAAEENEPEEKKPSILLTIILGCFWIIPGVLYYVGYGTVQKNKVKKWHEENDSQIADMKGKQVEILNQCKTIIDG